MYASHMSVVLSGTFAIGWTSALVDALRARDLPAIGESALDDPFALLMHRAKALAANPDAIVVEAAQDAAIKHPQVDALLVQLADLLIPKSTSRIKIAVHVDPHEYFFKCVVDGVAGTHHDTIGRTDCTYLHGNLIKSMHVSSYIADTPEMLQEFVMTI